MTRTSARHYRGIAAYYDAENAHHEMLQEDVPLLLAHLPKRRQNILELAVGTGRAAIPLAQAGHRVVGIDYAEDMLELARRKRDAVGISSPDLQLIRADALKFDLRRKFDWVVILFNTFLGFATLPEQDALLQRVVHHLTVGGKFWLDVFQPNLALLAQDKAEDLEPVAFYVPSLQRTVFKTTSVVRDVAAQIMRVTFHYRWFDDGAAEHKQTVKFNLTFMFPRELEILLNRNGLKIEKLYGNYDASPLKANSPRMIALCRRR